MGDGWQGFPRAGWQSANAVRRRLDAGADPDGGDWSGPALHLAVQHGSAEAVAELAARVRDVDQIDCGRTALWSAVQQGKPDVVRVVLAAGADPLRPMMSGWSPARLSLATPDVIPSGEVLTARERELVAARDRTVAAIGDYPEADGFSIACVGGIDAAEAVRRLKAYVVPDDQLPDDLDDWWEEPFGQDTELAMGVSDVPGGCVVVQPWYFNASTPVVMSRLSAGTVAYGMFANPKSGNQGNSHRDGQTIGWDLHPGGAPSERDDTVEVLLAHLYRSEAVAYCCAYAGLRPEDDKAFTEPDRWVLLPDLSFWRA
jgi:hypothetical protein